MPGRIQTLIAGSLLLLVSACTDQLATAPQQALLSTTTDDATDYEPIILDGGQGGAAAINDAGIIAGIAGDGISGYPAVRWVVSSAGVSGPEKLGELPYPFHAAYRQNVHAMNSSGTVVGSAFGGVGRQWDGAWVYSDEMKLLPGFPGDTHRSAANGINDKGIIVGWIEFDDRAADGTISDRLQRGAVWVSTDVAPLLLPPLPGAFASSAGIINSDGLVTGYSLSGVDHAYVYVRVTWRINDAGELLDGPHPVEAGFTPTAVNDAGDMAGLRQLPGGGAGPALMRSGQIIALALLNAKDEGGAAVGIGEPDANGVVRLVGRSGSTPALWSVDMMGVAGVPTGLGLPKGSFYHATAEDVNARGWVVGSVTPRNGGTQPILWLPRQAGSGDGGGDPCKPHPRTGVCR
jgi:uncharacterized membrane protein